MDDVIFVREGGKLRTIERQSYEREVQLQELLASHPELLMLSGEQLRPGDPVRWLLVRREAGIADREGGSDRWSVDHLLVDQDATPTFVEVKRGTDTRIRREVVGQMLDYAANATAHWPVSRIRELALAEAGTKELLQERVRALIGSEPGDDDAIEAFWATVDQNLKAGSVRLLFVADEIPRELRRIIEFLNQHMPAVEVLGVEIVRYVRDGVEAFVPRVVGQTEGTRQARETGAPRRLTTAAAFLERCAPHARPVFERILAEAPLNGAKVVWGTKGFSVRAGPEARISLFYGFPPSTVQAYVAHLPVDAQAAARTAFLGVAPFREAGQYTLDLALLDPPHDGQRAVDELWRQVRAAST